jgi:hypothetical protein
MEQTELRERLDRLAWRSAPQVRDAGDLAHDIAAGVRTRRRREWTVAALAAVLVAVLVGVPALRSKPERDVQPAAPSPGVYSTHTRGNLAGDSDFVDAVPQLPWTGPAGAQEIEPPLDSRHVVFAGLAGGAKWALVAGVPPGVPTPPDEDADGLPDLDRLESFAVAWFSGPSGAGAGEMTVYGEPRIVDADEPTAVLSPTKPYGGSSGSALIVVAAPGDQIEVSGVGFIGPDGDIRREFSRESMVDGVHVSEGGQVDASVDLSVRYRVVRGGTEFVGRPDTEPAPDFVPPRVDLARLRPTPPPAPGDAAVTSAIDELLSHLGLWAHVLDFTVLWAGDVPTPDGVGARLTVLGARLMDGGGSYVTGALGREFGGQLSAGTCGAETRPDSDSVDEMVAVLRCGSAYSAEGPLTDNLVVVAPPEATTARALDDRGEQIASYALVDGVAVVPIPPDLASVAVIGADGVTIDERAPMGQVDWGD